MVGQTAGRAFFWREPGVSPFAVLVAEILLAKTRAEVVAPVAGELLVRFPAPFVLPSPRATAGNSDLRYAIEAVAHMARTNADAMRAVAESQAEWIKSISSARGFFRNAQPLPLSPTAEARETDDDGEDEAERRPDWIEVLQPIVGSPICSTGAASSESARRRSVRPSILEPCSRRSPARRSRSARCSNRLSARG